MPPRAGGSEAPAPPPQDENADKGKRSRKGKHPGRAAVPPHIERIEVVKEPRDGREQIDRCAGEKDVQSPHAARE
jgi:hypothetical protein